MVTAIEQFFPNSDVMNDPAVHPPNTEIAPDGRPQLKRTQSSRRRSGLYRVNTGLSDVVGEGNGERPGGYVLVIDGAALNHVRSLFLLLFSRGVS